mmetsp:Transcript_22474/g.52269  ORF Transcript_22474/g.52269 Transcript_22474/m.52269 type:complete len:284 (+) Transcript_22474:153-1004(+)
MVALHSSLIAAQICTQLRKRPARATGISVHDHPLPRPLPPRPLPAALPPALPTAASAKELPGMGTLVAFRGMPKAFSSFFTMSQTSSLSPWMVTSSSGMQLLSTKPRPAFTPPPKTPTAAGSASQTISVQSLVTLISVASLTKPKEFLPSSCFAAFLTSTLPWPPASLMAAFLPSSARPSTCFAFTHPLSIFSFGKLHSTHSSSTVTGCLFGRWAATFFFALDMSGLFLMSTLPTPKPPAAAVTSTFSFRSIALYTMPSLRRPGASLLSLGRNLRGTDNLTRK